MKHFIQNLCKGMYDSLTNKQKEKITYKEIEDVMLVLIPEILSKLGMVILALMITIPFLITFHISNGIRIWVLELCLWMVWIKTTVQWKSFKEVLKKMQSKD